MEKYTYLLNLKISGLDSWHPEMDMQLRTLLNFMVLNLN